jgi:hypothetical protein
MAIKVAKILLAMSIVGFAATTFSHLISLILIGALFPYWLLPLVFGVFFLGIFAVIVCILITCLEGVLGGIAQWKWIYSRCPKWCKNANYFLVAYGLLRFLLFVIFAQNDSVDRLPLGPTTAFLMPVYFGFICTFYAALLPDPKNENI